MSRAQLALPPWLRSRWGAVVGLAGLYVLVYVAWTYARWGDEAQRSLISNVAYLPMSLLATIVAARTSLNPRLEAPQRRAWLYLTLCLAAYFVGDLLFFYLEDVLAQAQAGLALTAADVFYLAFYPLALLGLLSLPSVPLRGGERLRFLFDLGIVMITAWMAVWYFVIAPTASQTQPDLLNQIVSAAYPIGDLVILAGLVVILFRRPDAATRSTLILLVLALVNFVAADLAYAYTRLAGTYVSGGWIDVGWIVAYLFFALAAVRQPYLERGSLTERWSAQVLERLSLLLPLAATGVGYALVLAISVSRITPDSRIVGLLVSAALLTLFVVGRQAVALVDNLRLNAELRALSASLEQRVAERTTQLQQAQDELLQSQKLAIVGTMAAEVVHEVSNPLNLIINASETLETQLRDEGQVDGQTLGEFLPIISRAAWHGARMLQSLRLLSGRNQPQLESNSVSDVVQEALLLLGHQFQGKWKTTRLVVEVPAGLPPVVCDRSQIAQVLINLLNNARDALPPETGGAITLRARQVSDGVAIDVIDTGAGIPAETLGQIFKPFFTTKPLGRGTGLGLSIVERIVREHRGSITAASAGPGLGTTFTVTLPTVAQAMPDQIGLAT